MVTVRQGDYGIRVNVSHTSLNPVYFSIDGGELEALVDNSYFIITDVHTEESGTKEVTFSIVTESSVVTSPDVFRFVVLPL